MLTPERLLLLTTVCEVLQLEGSVSRPDYSSTEKETVACGHRMDIEDPDPAGSPTQAH